MAIGAVLSACDEPAPTPSSKADAMFPAAIAQRSRCPERQTPNGAGGSHTSSTIAADMRDVVSTGRTVITIRSLSGDPICVPLGWIDTVEEFYLSDDKRLLDFDHSGFEDDGHFLIDRRSRQIIETGNQPEASDDATMLVAVPPERYDDGDPAGVGIWQVLPGRIVQRAMVPLPDAHAWRVDRWSGNTCAELSGVSSADYWGPDVDGSDSDAADAVIAKLRRLHFRVRAVGGRWRIEASQNARPCSVRSVLPSRGMQRASFADVRGG